MLLVACIVGFIVVYSITQRIKGVKLNFATRIQLYLNISFLLPLVTVSAIILSILNNNYQEDFNQAFIAKTESVGANLLSHLENYRESSISREQLVGTLSEIAQYVEVDINVFDPSGHLIASSQPAIYEAGLLSKHINPQALHAIEVEKNNHLMLREFVGDLNYRSVYVPMKSYETGELLGIVSIPFFEAQYELDKKLIEVLSIIINVFAAIFIVFIILSYFASQILTIPLRLITQKSVKQPSTTITNPWNGIPGTKLAYL
ncbi:MAG: hypothetical protein HC880_06735 [Bacteroidia bacterium]|nr:hypothetical protein [Bacteroidia bacterium]